MAWKRCSVVLAVEQLDRIRELSERLYSDEYAARPGVSEIVRAAIEALLSRSTGEQARIVREHWNPATRRVE
ncbi:MAG: hypothetical protein GF418_14630 [Chitinivibrionales bacterium]|nr:hypothetical protein [Chitinivibrionales bacterium]MBD3396856.1 hypothetical protein [Chitinivibrionales bacterium]